LPELYGKTVADIHGGSFSGCFVLDKEYAQAMWYGSTNVNRTRDWHMSAQAYNPIYGNSDTVTPESYSCKFFIKF
jgi:hypothetical protein